MTEPNRDTTNGPDLPGTPVPQPSTSADTASPLPSFTASQNPPLPANTANTAVPATTPSETAPQRPSETANPPLPANTANTATPAPSPSPLPGTWQPDPTVRHPGIFTRDATIPATTPGASFIAALRHIVDKGFGNDWHIRRLSDDTARIFSRTHDAEFEVAIRRPAARGDDFVTTVDHVVHRPDIAAALERLLGDHPERVSELTSLIVGFVREPVPGKPSEPLLRVGIGNRWPVHPSAAEEHRLAEFVAWNIQILLWLRCQARRQIHILLAAPRPAPRLPAIPAAPQSPPLPQSPPSPQLPQISPPLPANTANTAVPAPRSKGWESIPWPLGGNPFGPHIPWVGLCSQAIFQPLAFDLGYWLEYWAKPEVGGSGSISLIEAVRRALPVHLDAGWRIEYCGPSHQFLRHSEHPWIFQIKEKRTALGPLDNLPSYFGIGQPNGRFGCPNTSGIEVRLITTTLEHASAVAREVCDLRAGTSDIAASFFRDRSPDSVRWGIVAHLSSFITTPAHPQRHARPGFDASRWWSSPDQRLPFDTLRALWALKILHAACLRHRLTRLSDEWGR